MSSNILKLYYQLLKKYKDPKIYWPYWCSERKTDRQREVIAFGAILTQRTSWNNVERALDSLKKGGLLSLEKVAFLKNLDKLKKLIRPAGFYHAKSQRLHVFSSFVIKRYGGIRRLLKVETDILRKELLKIHGIGPETADTILLYALDKPSFVIDEYTRRFVRNYGLIAETGYEKLKSFFEKSLPRDVFVYQSFHVFIILEQKGKKAHSE